MRALHYGKAYIAAGGLSLLISLLYIAITSHTGKTYFDFLLWNLFLAWLPCLASGMMDLLQKRWRDGLARKRIGILGLAAIWLLFYPNSPYIVTDLIHLTINKNTYVSNGEYIAAYWADLVMIALFAWNGLLLAFLSMYQVHGVLNASGYRIISWPLIGMVCFLSGYGIWLGRVPRLNSWDVFTDTDRVLELMKQSASIDTLLFSGLFAVFIAAVYLTFVQLLRAAKGTP